MPNVRQRSQAKMRRRLKRELADESVRQTQRIERAITDAALRLTTTSDDMADMLPTVIQRWNTAAANIEAHFGARVFPVRLQHASAISLHFADVDGNPINPTPIYGRLSNRLSYMAAISGDPDTYKWMNDFLFMSLIVPEAAIIHEARNRDGLWRRKLRKQKLGMDPLDRRLCGTSLPIKCRINKGIEIKWTMRLRGLWAACTSPSARD